jgi:hypothetical protein
METHNGHIGMPPLDPIQRYQKRRTIAVGREGAFGWWRWDLRSDYRSIPGGSTFLFSISWGHVPMLYLVPPLTSCLHAAPRQSGTSHTHDRAACMQVRCAGFHLEARN